jgi:predicted HicB family RNase H-like nuclease
MSKEKPPLKTLQVSRELHARIKTKTEKTGVKLKIWVNRALEAALK